ncbi:MAG TPA: DUF5312 family protein [Spirochaetales bacterium]|nr:DUF5312 family protein [Spirochaetales bacterium]HRY54061.1 DUF5312 family protein [Spirochaetia bacterium]
MAGTGSKGTSPEKDGASGGILQKLLSIFAGMGDPDSEKKKLLRAVAKDLSRSRYKFYRPKGGEALPGLGKFFYEIYKITAPAQVLLGNAAGSGALRAFVIESYLSPEQRGLSERLTEAAILELAKKQSLRELQEAVKRDLNSFVAVFDGETSRQIDAAYNTLLAFVNFVNFDYYFLLKKFDSGIPERSFASRPKFESINGEYVADDLQDFLEVFAAIDFQTDWKRLFGALKDYRKVDVVQPEAWAKLAPVAEELRQSQVLEQIVRHVKKDPYWAAKPRIPGERIVEPFLQKLKTQIETILQGLVQERRNGKIDEAAKQIFGTSVVLRMKNYTDKANVVFAKKMLGGFTQSQSMNYLKAYLLDYFKKDIRELADLLIIRGQWTTSIQSQQLSDNYHALLEIADQIVQFDEALADEGELGTKLRSALAKADRDKEAVKYLRTLLKDVNDRATGMVSRAAMSLIGTGRIIKSLVEDLGRPHHELILNWKEVEGQSPHPLKEWMVEVYKKIYYMVQLLQFFTPSGSSE